MLILVWTAYSLQQINKDESFEIGKGSNRYLNLV